MFHGMISLNLVLLLLLVNFVSGYIYNIENIRSSLIHLISADCAAAIVHRNHFFRLYQREKSSDSKVKFRQASNRCKRVLEPAKLAYANKKSPLLPRNLALVTSGKLLIVFSKKVNLLYLLYSTGRRCCLVHLIKQNCLLKIFL